MLANCSVSVEAEGRTSFLPLWEVESLLASDLHMDISKTGTGDLPKASEFKGDSLHDLPKTRNYRFANGTTFKGPSPPISIRIFFM